MIHWQILWTLRKAEELKLELNNPKFLLNFVLQVICLTESLLLDGVNYCSRSCPDTEVILKTSCEMANLKFIKVDYCHQIQIPIRLPFDWQCLENGHLSMSWRNCRNPHLWLQQDPRPYLQIKYNDQTNVETKRLVSTILKCNQFFFKKRMFI